MSLPVDNYIFSFPTGWRASKYDEWPFFGQFSAMWSQDVVWKGGTKNGGLMGVDVLAIDPNGTLWLIEAKDLRWPGTVLPSTLAELVAQKVIGTLAALIPASCATHPHQAEAKQALGASTLRVVLHLEQPPRGTGPMVNKANIAMRLRRLLKAVDPKAIVVEVAAMQGLAWTVVLAASPPPSSPGP